MKRRHYNECMWPSFSTHLLILGHLGHFIIHPVLKLLFLKFKWRKSTLYCGSVSWHIEEVPLSLCWQEIKRINIFSIMRLGWLLTYITYNLSWSELFRLVSFTGQVWAPEIRTRLSCGVYHCPPSFILSSSTSRILYSFINL